MTAYTFSHPTEFVGPAGCVVAGHLVIDFDHSKAEPDVNWPGSITIESIVAVIGVQAFDFDGDYADGALVTSCWEHLAAERERIECERADMARDERDAGGRA